MRVEDVFGAADDVPAAEKRADKIDDVKRLKKQQPGGLPGKNHWAFQPQANCDQNVAEIAKIEKILQAVLTPVDRNPRHYRDSPENLEPQRQTHARHCIELKSPPLAAYGLAKHFSPMTYVTCW
jgi:hypothetical protein